MNTKYLILVIVAHHYCRIGVISEKLNKSDTVSSHHDRNKTHLQLKIDEDLPWKSHVKWTIEMAKRILD